MRENLAEARARLSHAGRARLAHSYAVPDAVAFQLPALAVSGGTKIAAWDRTPAPLPRFGDPWRSLPG